MTGREGCLTTNVCSHLKLSNTGGYTICSTYRCCLGSAADDVVDSMSECSVYQTDAQAGTSPSLQESPVDAVQQPYDEQSVRQQVDC